MRNFIIDFVNHCRINKKAKYFTYVFLLVLIITICISTIKVNKEIVSLGTLGDPSDFLTIGASEGETTYSKGDVNTIGVFVSYKPSLFQYLISKNNKKFEISDYDTSSDLNPSNQILRSTYLKDLCIDDALIVAYEKAMIKDSNIKIEYNFDGLLCTANLPTSYSQDIKIGDIIKSVSYNSTTYDLKDANNGKYLTYFSSLVKQFYADDPNCKFTFHVISNKEEKDIEFAWSENGSLGLELKEKFEITNAVPSYKIDPKTVHNSIGSSGGMMLTLAIYNSLLEEDITKGLKICGTGTVDIAGNIGAIGGIKQKIQTSQLYKADIFFSPYSSDETSYCYENYNDAYESYQLIKKPTFELVKITCFDDILNYLESVGK